MLEGLKDAMEYFKGLANAAEKTEVVEINGKTYANKSLNRYDCPEKAEPLKASSLTALVDYIGSCSPEMSVHDAMIIHVESPTRVRLMSSLDKERGRETLMVTEANVSAFRFDQWYDQERMMIEMQANFQNSPGREAILKMVGNIERRNSQNFTDNGTDQVVTMQVGVATKADVLVPNPVTLVPYRTFQEVDQPESEFVFRVGDGDKPAFKIVEAENGIWKNEAVANIKRYLEERLGDMAEFITSKIVIIG